MVCGEHTGAGARWAGRMDGVKERGVREGGLNSYIAAAAQPSPVEPSPAARSGAKVAAFQGAGLTEGDQRVQHARQAVATRGALEMVDDVQHADRAGARGGAQGDELGVLGAVYGIQRHHTLENRGG